MEESQIPLKAKQDIIQRIIGIYYGSTDISQGRLERKGGRAPKLRVSLLDCIVKKKENNPQKTSDTIDQNFKT